MTSIEIDICKNRDGRRDLARGLSGKYRYMTTKSNSSFKIHTVNLLRLSQDIEGLPEGFTGRSPNINAGRGSDYLYIIWKASQHRE